MRSLQDIEADIHLFLLKVDEMKYNDRKSLLMAMFQKHISLNESELILSKYDLDTIVNSAASIYSSASLPTNISGKFLLPNEAVNLALVESTIELLNSKGAIKRLPKFDRR
jgi:hypothetical protein